MDTPSSARRQALRRADEGNNIRISNDIPLERFYDISKRLISRFQEAFDQRRLDEAYVYGIRLASLCVDAIPKHSSYSQKRFSRQRKENGQKCDRILKLLEIVRQRMDAEEILKHQAAEEERKRKEIVDEEERKRKQQQQLEEKRLKEQEQQKQQQQQPQVDVKQSALAKLSAMQNQISAPPTKQKKSTKMEKPKTVEPVDSKKEVQRVQPSVPTKSKPQNSGKSVAAKTKTVNKAGQKLKPIVQKHDEEKKNLNVKTAELDPAQKPESCEESSSDVVPTTKTPRRQQEEKIIDMLQAAIDAQEKRLKEVEHVSIPKLLKRAKKEHTTAKSCKDPNERSLHRKAALHCVGKKRQLERQVETTKAAIFHMETQMFLLENAMEDRQITKAMDDANQAMHSLQESVGVSDLANLSTLLAEPLQTIAVGGEEESEQELLEELEEWLDMPKSKTKESTASKEAQFDDDVSILSLPQVPKTDSAARASSVKEKEKPGRKLLKAIF